MKQVVVIVSSPLKNGNASQLASQLEHVLLSFGDTHTERIYLSDVVLGLCKGCHTCIMRNESFCPLKDDRDMVLQKIENADGVILLTPIYCMHVSTLMKVFIDHLAFLWHRPRLFKQKFLVACVGAGGGPVAAPVLDYMALNAARWGATVVSKLAILRFDTPFSKQAAAKQTVAIHTAAAKLHYAMNNPQPHSPSLADLFWFQVWRNAALTGKAKQSVDYLYWKQNEWLNPKTHFFYQTRINPLYLTIITLGSFLMQLFMRSMYTTTKT